MQWKRYIPDSQDNAILAVLVLIGAVLGAKEALGLFISDERAKYLLFAVVLIAIYRYAARIYRTSRLPGLPAQPKIFNPFWIRTEAAGPKVWRREEEEAELLARLDSAKHSHLVITGPSGAGKSTLIHDLVKPALEAGGVQVRFFSNYQGFVIDLIEDFGGASDVLIRQRTLAQKYRAFMGTHTCSIRDVFDPTHQSLDAEALWTEIAAYLDSVLSADRRTVFIFDQIERLVHLLRTDGTQPGDRFNGYQIYFFVELIRYLRMKTNVRTVFVIRAEYLYQSFDFLENATSAHEDKQDVLLVHFLCPGINTMSSAGAVSAIREDFKKIPSAASYAQAFEHINGLHSRAFSNTFLTQLFGYLVEHFYRSDERVAELLQNGTDRTLALRYFFEYLLNDYARRYKEGDALDVLRAVIFTVATENRLAGQAVTVKRLAALAHLPESNVTQALGYLSEVGVLREEQQEGRPAYRMVHDIISDYAIENERFSINPVLKDAIRGLSEARVRTETLTSTKNFVNPLEDWVVEPNIGLAAIWLFYLFGATKVSFAWVCDAVHTLLSHMWAERDCKFVGQFYLVVFLMHAVWVTYIYVQDRGYLRYVLKNPIARLISKALPVIGVVLGIAFSQSPALFGLPLSVVGILMGLLLIWGSYDGSFAGRVASENRVWGVRTILNMIFASALMGITAFIIWDDAAARDVLMRAAKYVGGFVGLHGEFNADDGAIAWMYFVNIVMLYFWWHIRPEQQSRVSLAARLAAQDRTHLEGARV